MLNKNIAIIGNFFGDEGKARVVHWMAKKYKYIVRFSGSSNAGHTIYHQGKKIIRHLLPSADFSSKNQFAVLASGMVINPLELLKEVQETEELFPGAASHIIVDPDAFVITNKHIFEDKENIIKYGSTGKGVSVAYRDKIYRRGIKIQNLINDNNEIINALKQLGVQFKYNLELYDEFNNNSILFEGAQSVLLDINFGTYPYVTSGECTPGGIFNSGFAYAMPSKVYGISKVYSTRVGEGPFPTEIHGEEAENFRNLGQEFGATTGRPRKVGWLDLPALRYAIKKSGINSLVLTKFDILNGLNTIKVCSSYEKEPVSSADFFDAKPNFVETPGWQDGHNISQIAEFVGFVQKGTGVPVEYISCGTSENDLFEVNME